MVKSALSSLRGIWKYPCTASMVAKTFDPAGMLYMMSVADGKGWTGLLMYLLRATKSVTILRPFPLGLGTKNAGEIHSVGCVTRSMMPLSNRSSMSACASSLQCTGICLAVSVFLGLMSTSSLIWMFMASPFMGVVCILSEKMSVNSCSSSSFVVWCSLLSITAWASAILGKSLLMTPMACSSCHPISSCSSNSATTRAESVLTIFRPSSMCSSVSPRHVMELPLAVLILMGCLGCSILRPR